MYGQSYNTLGVGYNKCVLTVLAGLFAHTATNKLTNVQLYNIIKINLDIILKS